MKIPLAKKFVELVSRQISGMEHSPVENHHDDSLPLEVAGEQESIGNLKVEATAFFSRQI
jgi:hypothetical protein